MAGSVWVLSSGGEEQFAGGTRLGVVDARLGAPSPPRGTTVRAALLTGKNPLPATGGEHQRGRPSDELAEFVRAHALWDGPRDVWANAHRPDDFRGAPSVPMVAAEASGVTVRTLGHLRRGEAVAGDVTGALLIRRGHGEIALDPPARVADRLEAWSAAGQRVWWELDPQTDGRALREVLGMLAARGVPWAALVLPGAGAARWPDNLPVWSSRRWPLPSSVAEVLPAWWEATA